MKCAGQMAGQVVPHRRLRVNLITKIVNLGTAKAVAARHAAVSSYWLHTLSSETLLALMSVVVKLCVHAGAMARAASTVHGPSKAACSPTHSREAI